MSGIARKKNIPSFLHCIKFYVYGGTQMSIHNNMQINLIAVSCLLPGTLIQTIISLIFNMIVNMVG